MSISETALAAIYKVGYSIPGIAQLNRDLNIVKRLLVLPCDNPVGVYVELAAEASIKMMWSIAEPDPKETYHIVAGHSALCEAKMALTEATEGSGETTSAVTRTFGTLGEVYDLAVWRLFLLGVASQGLHSFSSQIFRMQACTNKDDPNYGQGGAYVGAINANGDWQGLDFSYSPPSIYAPVGGSGITAKPHRTALLACSAQFQAFGGMPVGTGSRIIRQDTGAMLDIDYNFTYDSTGKMQDPDRSNHVFYKSKSQFAQDTELHAEWSYNGDPLPLGEAFPIHSTMHSSVYS